MKRYFDIAKDKIALKINFNKEGMEYSVKEVEQAINIKGLREVSEEEFCRLKSLYTSIENNLS